MRLRLVAIVIVLGWSLAGCSDDDSSPTLTITPSGMAGKIDVSGPTAFSAVLVGSSAEVTWTVSGGGTLSNTSGRHVSFRPPPGAATGSLTATAGELTATVQIASGPATITSKVIPGLTKPVTVQHDAQDIPHIRCATTVDCLAVQGYVQARDRWFQMDFLRHVARGRLAELIGLAGLSQDVQLRTLFTTRAGHRVENDLVQAMDPAIKALVAGYVRGVNAYLAELRAGNNAQLPAEYAQLPFRITPADLADWELEDTVAMARLQQFQLSESISEETEQGQFAAKYASGPLQDLGKLDAWIRAAAPATEQAYTLSGTAQARPLARNTVAAAPAPAVDLAPWAGPLTALSADARALRSQLRPAGADVGSNNWVISKDRSATGAAMVANDPHLGLQYPPLFHLATLTSTTASDNLDLTGGAFPGIPGALVGRGAHVAWGVTVVGYDVTDLYLEQFAPQASCPTAAPCVVFNAGVVSTIPAPQSYRVRVGSGAAGVVDSTTLPIPNDRRPPAAVLVVPHHGPIIQAPDAAGKAVSVRWTGQEGNTQDVRAILGLNTATDVDDAIRALKDFSTGAQNFVLADDKGDIAYDPHALVPVRKFTETARPLPPWFPLPGDGSAEWGDGVSDCASATLEPVPASCWIADDLLPQGKNPAKGYFFTANSDPTTASHDNNPLAHPPYLSFSWSDSTGFRATRIEQRIKAAIAANGKLSLADMESIQADNVSRPGMAFTPIIAQLPAAGSPPELAAARALLAQWAANGWACPTGLLGHDPKNSPADPDAKVVQDSSGCFLFHTFLRTLATNVFTDDLRVAGQSVNGVSAIKAMLFMLALDPAAPETAGRTKFCNDVDAAGAQIAAHTCPEQVATALVQAYRSLSARVSAKPSDWVWGRVHTIQPVSLLALVTTDFAPGPYARHGGAFTVDVGNPSLSGSGLAFSASSGANVRHISVMDPAKAVVRMQLPGPERDGPAVSLGPDLLGQWVRNTYFDFAHGAQIESAALSTQTFQAQ